MINWSWDLFVPLSHCASASMAGEARPQVLQGLRRLVKVLDSARKYHEGPATYQLLVLFVLAMHVLSRLYVGEHHFDVPIPEGCRERYILRSERTSVICLLLHWPASSRGTRNEPVRRDSRD